MTNTQKRYAQFNALTVTGRIFNAEIVTQADGSQFLAVSLISTATTDGADLVYNFTNNNGLLALHKKGMFNKGREVTITGHIAGVRTAYETKQGEVKLLTRPELRMIGAQVLEGGLGRMPQEAPKTKSLGGMTVTVDKTPTMQAAPEIVGYDAA